MQGEYEFVSGWVQVNVTERDLENGNANAIIAGQITNKISEMARDGWEFYQNIPVTVRVLGSSGCFATLMRRNNVQTGKYSVYILIFRRVVR